MALPAQGVMLSERPSAGLGGSTHDASTPLAGAGSIGNYKGVMLCNRPFAGVAAAVRAGDAATAVTSKGVFLTGKVKKEMGYAGRNLHTEKLLRKRVKKDTALTRHKRWLADLQLTKQTLEEQYMEDLQRKEESKRRFAEREARMRKVTRELALHEGTSGGAGDGRADSGDKPGNRACSIGLADAIDRANDAAPADDKNLTPLGECMSLTDQKGPESRISEEGHAMKAEALRAVEKRRRRDGKPCRPMWAFTEGKADAESDLRHEQELEELLEFTRGLDFKKYIRDAEVQSMIDQVKRRIAEIERQPDGDDAVDVDDDGDACDANSDALDEADARLEAKILKLTDRNLRDMDKLADGEAPAEDMIQPEDDNMSVARTALSEGGRSVRSVHSRRSLTAVAERVREAISAARAAGCGTAPSRLGERGAAAGTELTDKVVNDVVVVTHKDDGGLRLGGKNTVSNLPYIRRNPAI